MRSESRDRPKAIGRLAAAVERGLSKLHGVRLCLALVGVPLLVWAALVYLQRIAPDHDVTRVEHALFRALTPATDADPVAIRLPHDWRRAGVRVTQAEYRYSIDLPRTPDRPWAILVPRVATSATILLNGEPLADGSLINALQWNRPVYYPLPGALLVAGRNEFIVTVSAEPENGGLLRELYIGPQDRLASDFARQYFVNVVIVGALIVLTTMGALFMAALAWRQRAQPLCGGYALLFAVWPLHALHCLIDEIPNVLTVRIGVGVAALTLLSAVALALYRLTGRVQRLERTYCAYFMAGSVLLAALAAIDAPLFHWCSHRLWHNALMLVAIFAFIAIVRGCMHRPEPGTALVLGSGVLLLVFGLHDWLVQNGEAGRDYPALLDHGRSYALMVFGYFLLARFMVALRAADKLNAELENRVEHKHAELLANYERLRVLERDRILAEERERIMRDMHDGVGGQIVSLLALIEGGRASLLDVSDALRTALEDLRVMIDSLDPSVDSVTAALGMLRSRIELRLRRAGIALSWNVEDTPPLANAGPAAIINVSRVVQEAISNAIRHAEATWLGVSLHNAGAEATIEIRDNGHGMRSEAAEGRGLRNMRRRAAMLGAKLEVASAATGTRVRLRLRCAAQRKLLPDDHASKEVIAANAVGAVSEQPVSDGLRAATAFHGSLLSLAHSEDCTTSNRG